MSHLPIIAADKLFKLDLISTKIIISESLNEKKNLSNASQGCHKN